MRIAAENAKTDAKAMIQARPHDDHGHAHRRHGSEHRHGEHGHHHDHGRHHHHDHHDQHHDHDHGTKARAVRGDVLVVRPNSGLSGDIFVAGLARMAGLDGYGLSVLTQELAIPVPPDSVHLQHHSVNDVAGWMCAVSLPDEHVHRTLADILGVIEASALTATAKGLACKTFTLLAEAEGRVHRMLPQEVTFHEVGALDSILDICLAAALFDRISPAAFVCGPLPLCDGVVRCSHGLVPAPAPAVLELLEGVPVRGIATEGETVTPTAIALLKGLGATFGPWPDMTVSRRALVYGTKVFAGVPNGAIFVLGRASSEA